MLVRAFGNRRPFFMAKYSCNLTEQKDNKMAGRKKTQDDNFEQVLKDFSNQYFDRELQHAHDLFSDASWPKEDDAHYVKKATFLINARKSHLMLLKTMCQHITGAVSGGKEAIKNDKQAEKLLEQALQRIGLNEKKND